MLKHLKSLKSIHTTARIISILSVLGIVVIVVVFMVLTDSHYKENANTIYLLTESGDVLIANKGYAAANRHVEVEAHVRLFYYLFFEIDYSNYESRINKALFLGSDELYNLYNQLNNKNWFANVKQYNVIQRVKELNIQVDNVAYPYKVIAQGVIEVDSDLGISLWTMDIDFEIINLKERTTNNPHALYINFIHTEIKQQ